MKSKYAKGFTENFSKNLDSKNLLNLIGLLIASNDLLTNIEAIEKFPENENSYFFYNSISIVRELALLVIEIEKSNLHEKFSKNTGDLFEKLKSELTPFHEKSLVKSVLKPIRDFTFHYNLSKTKDTKKLDAIVKELKALEEIEVGLSPNKHSPIGQRYTFADRFRSDFVNQFLTKEIVSKVSIISVDVVCFADSLMADLAHKKKT